MVKRSTSISDLKTAYKINEISYKRFTLSRSVKDVRHNMSYNSMYVC